MPLNLMGDNRMDVGTLEGKPFILVEPGDDIREIINMACDNDAVEWPEVINPAAGSLRFRVSIGKSLIESVNDPTNITLSNIEGLQGILEFINWRSRQR